MADSIDDAQTREHYFRETALSQRHQFEGESQSHCMDCGDAIPETRRQLIKGVQRCVSCQEDQETQQRYLKRIGAIINQDHYDEPTYENERNE